MIIFYEIVFGQLFFMCTAPLMESQYTRLNEIVDRLSAQLISKNMGKEIAMQKKLTLFILILLLAIPLAVQSQDDENSVPDLGEPFIGELVDVNGRNVLVHCVGEGSPTVWLENGWAAMVVTWQPFQEQLAEHTRVCAYDRAGMGWSEANGSDRSAQNSAAEFAELLDVLGETDPFVLVAWSCGTPISQIYAANHPDMVLGMVFIDGCGVGYDEFVMETFPSGTGQSPAGQVSWLETVDGYAQAAANGELLYDDISWWFNATSSELYGEDYYNLILDNPEYWNTYRWETLYGVMGVNSDQVEAVATVSDIPITAIVTVFNPAEDADVASQTRGWMWRTAQLANLAYTTNPTIVWAETEHAVFREDPDLVIDAILDMMNSVEASAD
jgi:pimeloyl-ACP methyl ester carboxylesterase